MSCGKNNPAKLKLVTKGGLILESFSFWFKSPKKGAKLLSCTYSLLVDSVQDSDLAQFLEDLSQGENFLRLIHNKIAQRLYFFFGP